MSPEGLQIPSEEKPKRVVPLPPEWLEKMRQQDQQKAESATETPPLPEETEQIEVKKAEREQQRLDRIDEVRKELGMPPEVREPKGKMSEEEKVEIREKFDFPAEAPEANEKKPEEPRAVDPEREMREEKRKERREKEDVEEFSRSLKRLSQDFDELSSTIARNKFPRVRFDSDQLIRAGSGEAIDSRAISQGLENLNASISRIKMPEDRREMMELEPHNIRSIIGGIEDVEGGLLKLKNTFEKAESGDYGELAKEASRTLGRIRSKKEGLHDAVGILQRIKGR